MRWQESGIHIMLHEISRGRSEGATHGFAATLLVYGVSWRSGLCTLP